MNFFWDDGLVQEFISYPYLFAVYLFFKITQPHKETMVGPLEIGANYILKHPPEKVGCVIEDLARLFQSDFSVPTIRISYVIPWDIFFLHAMSFCWCHPEFNNPHKDFYLAEGVHLNPSHQYLLYRSCRGVVLKAVGLLQKN